MVCTLEDMLKKSSKADTDSIYKEQHGQIFEENIMLKEENQILQDKLLREGQSSASEQHEKIGSLH